MSSWDVDSASCRILCNLSAAWVLWRCLGTQGRQPAGETYRKKKRECMRVQHVVAKTADVYFSVFRGIGLKIPRTLPFEQTGFFAFVSMCSSFPSFSVKGISTSSHFLKFSFVNLSCFSCVFIFMFSYHFCSFLVFPMFFKLCKWFLCFLIRQSFEIC